MGFEKSDNIGSFQIPLFYVIRNSVGIPYYIKRHCVPESAVRGEEYCIMALLMQGNRIKNIHHGTKIP